MGNQDSKGVIKKVKAGSISPDLSDQPKFWSGGLIQKGKKLINSHKYGEDLAVFNEIIKFDPINYEAYQGKAMTLQYLHRFGEAIETYKILIDKLEKGNHLYEATQYCDRILAINPTDDAYVRKGLKLEQLREYKKALEAYRQALEVNHESILACKAIARLLNRLNRREEALEYIKMELNMHKSCDSMINQASILQELKQFQESIDVLNEALDYCEDKKSKQIIQINCLKAEAFSALGHFENALTCFNNAIAIIPEPYHYLKVAEIYIGQEKFDQAIESYDNAISLEPTSITNYLFKGALLLDLHRYPEALECYQTVVKLQPNSWHGYNGVGLVQREMERYDDALTSFDKALRRNQNQGLCYSNKATCLFELEMYKDALELINKAIKIDNDPLDYFRRAEIYLNISQDKKALEDLNTASELIQNQGISQNLLLGTRKKLMSLETQRKILIEKINSIQEEVSEIIESADQSMLVESQVSQKFRRLSVARKELIVEAVSDLRRKSTNSQTKGLIDQIESLTKELNQLKKCAMQHEVALQDGGVYEQASIKQGFQDLKKEDQKLYDYAKNIYWVLFNYFSAYRILSTEMIEFDYQYNRDMTELSFMNGAKVIATIGKDLVAPIPGIGQMAACFNDVIDKIYRALKKVKYRSKVNIITKIIIDGNESDQQLSLKIAKIALYVASAKKKEILNPKIEKTQTKIAKFGQWVKSKIQKLLKKAKSVIADQVDIYDQDIKMKAFTDASLILAYLFKNYSNISAEQNIEDFIKSAIVHNKIDKLLDSIDLDELEKDV